MQDVTEPQKKYNTGHSLKIMFKNTSTSNVTTDDTTFMSLWDFIKKIKKGIDKHIGVLYNGSSE